MENLIKLIYASGEASPDMRYAAGFSTPDAFFCFECGNRRGVVTSPLESNRARAEKKAGVEVYDESFFSFSPDPVEVVQGISRHFQCGEFLVPKDFPLALADALRSQGLTVTAAQGVFCPEREFKREEELPLIIASQRAGEAGCRRAFEVLKEAEIRADDALYWQNAPLTSEVLRSEIDVEMVRKGMLPTGTICAGGVQSSQPHNVGSGPLYAHTPIVMDIFPKSASTGYWGDLTRTVVKGRAPEIVKRAFDAVLEARESAKRALCIGADPAEIHRLAADVLDRHGFHTGHGDNGDFGFFHGLGHGVGLDIHEAPRLSPRSEKPLKGGEVVTVEPGLYYPEWGGIRLEDLVYIAPDGARCLTEIETNLEID